MTEGEWIAEVDRTGNSTGNHLHLQLVLHDRADRTFATLQIDGESLSRNPELWLSPYGGNTGTVVGRLANSNGDPMGAYNILGLGKQWSTYTRTLTYGYTYLNRDDLLLENWATTDVTPGAYALSYRPASGGSSTALGTYNVAANQVTYVGLYPKWLPHYSQYESDWKGTLYLWNQHEAHRTTAYTTMFKVGPWIAWQDSRSINARAGTAVSLSVDGIGHGLTVPRREASTCVANEKLGQPYSSSAYSGIPASKLSDRAYVPLLLNRRTTASGLALGRIFVQNAGTTPTQVTLRFYNPDGSLHRERTETVEPHNRHVDTLYGVDEEWYGSAEIIASSGARLAVVWEIRVEPDTLMTAEGFPAHTPHTEWLVPLFTVRLANGLSTPVTFQNTSGYSIPVGGLQMVCTKDPNSPPPSTLTLANNHSTIAPKAAYSFNPVTDYTLPGGWYGSCRLTSTRSGVVFVQMRHVGGTGNPENAAAYEAIPTTVTARALSFPRVAQNPVGGGFATCATIQNVSNAYAAHVTLQYYGSPECGSGNVGPIAFTIPAGGSLIRNHRLTGTDGLPAGWCGYLLVTSSDEPIDGFMQLTNWNNPPGDTFMAHNAALHP